MTANVFFIPFQTESGALGAPFSSDVVRQIPSCFTGADVQRTARTGVTAKGLLYTRARYETIMGKTCYDDLTRWISEDMEVFHNAGHSMISGTMGSVACSPGDPMFWLHHCNVDCLWEDFRQNRQPVSDRTLQYPLSNFGKLTC